MRVVKRLASLRLTLVAMSALALLALLGARTAAVSVDLTAIPLWLLTVNLLAALVANRTLRTQTGLLVFHVGLLLVFACIGLTVVTRFDGHVEVVQGGAFDAAIVETREQGWLHDNRLDGVEFYQGDIRVDYLPRLLRRDTRSAVAYRTRDGGLQEVAVGDKHGFEVDGYRFLATFNKGFALLLHWQGVDGTEAVGSVNLLSYPRHDWNQVTTWTTPAGEAIELELVFDRPYFDEDSAWALQATDVPYRVRVAAAGSAGRTVREGALVELRGGTMRVADLRLWMAYRIDYLPFLPWMFVAAMLAIIGLAMHFASRYLPQHAAQANDSEEAEGAHVARV